MIVNEIEKDNMSGVEFTFEKPDIDRIMASNNKWYEYITIMAGTDTNCDIASDEGCSSNYSMSIDLYYNGDLYKNFTIDSSDLYYESNNWETKFIEADTTYFRPFHDLEYTDEFILPNFD